MAASALSLEPGLPLLIVVEGENDICFLKAMSAMLHRVDADLPDLTQLTAERRAVFLTTSGNNLTDWIARIASLHKRVFYLFDREQEPETTARKQALKAIADDTDCAFAMTSKRSVENYLHPLAILEACGIDFCFGDDTDVASLLALRMYTRNHGASCWDELPYKRQRRLHDKAKKILNVKAAQRMTPALLAQQDPSGEVESWLKTIDHLVNEEAYYADPAY
jgi:hypothetical protein